ncbi:MAG: vanadium-dependent haloperoxidase [Chlorobi bacterium]|nr:vanadium-dependent haloperoxidase [Chlorobiota bacterium]MCI0715797.1 vanadium-dependent haloperoxidase [Chlorobiota bacterium]
MKIYRKLSLYSFIVIFSVLIYSCSDSTVSPVSSVSVPASNIDAKYALDWMDIEYQIIADQHNDSPPPPSRLYSYSCITIYECVRPGIPLSLSLSGQLNDMPLMPAINQTLEYDWPTVIAGAIPLVMRGTYDTLFPSAVNLVNQKYNSVLQERGAVVSQEVIDRSLQHGIAIADKILDWAAEDNYAETRNMSYTPPPRTLNPANWEPINPEDIPNEPYWGTLRPFVVQNTNTFFSIPHPQFSTNSGGFYDDAMELVQISQNLTLEQKRIANFWNDKIRTGTPSGHWVSIMSQIARILNLKLDRVAQMYALMGPTMADGFIVCWNAKYRYNILRPQSYIRDYIDPNWNPFLITPSFPAYPSGHSSLSGACAEIMTHLFGNVPFTDYTHQQLGYLPRSFETFNQVAEEAAFSRLYGGIHYRFDSENGLEGGHDLGRYILQRIRLTVID